MSRRAALPGCLLACALALNGCGGSAGDGGEPATAAAPAGLQQDGQSTPTVPDAGPTDQAAPSSDGDAPTDAPVEAPTDAPAAEPEFQADIAPVRELRGVVYTNTEIELFWEPAAAQDGVVAYRIERDGQILDTRDGLSFYEARLTPGSTLRYTVRPVDRNGDVGPADEIELITPPAGPEITDANAEQLLAYLLELASARGMASLESQALRPAQGDAGRGEPETAFDAGLGTPVTRASCANGGSVYSFQSPSATGGGASGFVDCRDEAPGGFAAIDGSDSVSNEVIRQVFDPGFETDRDFAFRIERHSGEELTVAGSLARFRGTFNNDSRRTLDYAAPAPQGRTVASTSTRVHAGTGPSDAPVPFGRTWSADIVVQSPATGNRPVELETSEPFTTDSSGSCYATGKFAVVAIDDSRLEVDADTGSNETFRLSVVNAAGRVERLVGWSQQFAIDTAEVPDENAAPVYSGSAVPGCG